MKLSTNSHKMDLNLLRSSLIPGLSLWGFPSFSGSTCWFFPFFLVSIHGGFSLFQGLNLLRFLLILILNSFGFHQLVGHRDSPIISHPFRHTLTTIVNLNGNLISVKLTKDVNFPNVSFVILM